VRFKTKPGRLAAESGREKKKEGDFLFGGGKKGGFRLMMANLGGKEKGGKKEGLSKGRKRAPKGKLGGSSPPERKGGEKGVFAVKGGYVGTGVTSWPKRGKRGKILFRRKRKEKESRNTMRGFSVRKERRGKKPLLREQREKARTELAHPVELVPSKKREKGKKKEKWPLGRNFHRGKEKKESRRTRSRCMACGKGKKEYERRGLSQTDKKREKIYLPRKGNGRACSKN